MKTTILIIAAALLICTVQDVLGSGGNCQGQSGQCASGLCCSFINENNRKVSKCCSLDNGSCCVVGGTCCPENYQCTVNGMMCVSVVQPTDGSSQPDQIPATKLNP